MRTTRHLYNNHEIDFTYHGSNVMVNATKMAKSFNKKVENFTRLETSKQFIEECLKNANQRFLSIRNEQDLIISRQKSGTYMHRILALKFAAWLNPAFELWIFGTIDQILYANFNKLREATLEKLRIEKESKLLRQELLNKSPDEFGKFLEMEGKLTKADRKRINAIKASTYELRLNFNDN